MRNDNDPGGVDISAILATYTEERWQRLINAVQPLRKQTSRVFHLGMP
jgi:hypothetical protein